MRQIVTKHPLKYIIQRWLVTRMAAQEFYFKSPFEIDEEYTIMKSLLFFALVPFELLFVFTYARIYGSLRHYTWHIIILMSLINLAVSNLIINCVKNDNSIKEAISRYEKLDYAERKELYSLKNVAGIISLMVLVPWSVLFIGIIIVCHIFSINI